MIAIIPARGQSKRIPNKNLVNLCGKPLIQHSIEFAKQNELIKEVYVTSDSPEILELSVQLGAQAILRPGQISGDFEPTITAVEHAMAEINKNTSTELFCLLQPTNPFRPSDIILKALKVMQDAPTQACFTVSTLLKKLGKIEQNRFRPFNYNIGQRSQDLEPLYFENGLLYLFTEVQVKSGKLFDEYSYPLIENHPFATIDIDEPEDLKYAEFIFQQYTL